MKYNLPRKLSCSMSQATTRPGNYASMARKSFVLMVSLPVNLITVTKLRVHAYCSTDFFPLRHFRNCRTSPLLV